MSTFKLRIAMHSDWRIGSGKGRQGAVDELVQRDGDGFPFIPVSTLRGVWRDSAEQLAYALDGGPDGQWQHAVSHLFGSQPAIDDRGKKGCEPIKSLLSPMPARMEDAVRARLSGDNKKPLRDALTFIKPGVGIDPETGSAKENFLRFIEISRTGTVLECAATINSNDDVMRALAICSAAMVTSIGGERRRGAGKCKVSISGDTRLEDAVEMLKTNDAPTAPSNGTNHSPKPAYDSNGTGDFTCYPLAIELLSPVIVPDEILGNTVTTKDYIPGTLLLGAVVKALGIAGMDSAIVNGDLRVLPAYPRASGKRSLPSPLCWRSKKDDGEQPEMRNEIKQTTPVDKPWKAPGDRFCLPDGKSPRFVRKSIAAYTHNTVEDQSQTPTSDVGGVYTYEALSEGRVYQAELWVLDGLLNSLPQMSGKAGIGRAVNAGYGLVEITAGDGETVKPVNNARGNEADLYFASDCLLPPSASPEDGLEILLKRAGITFSGFGKTFIKTLRHEGWMPRAGMPKASQVAIAAGSVVQLANAVGDLDALAREGLGARRAEGFGVVEINPDIVTGDLCKQGAKLWSDPIDNPQVNKDKLRDLSGQAEEFLKTVEEACLKQHIRERAEQYANDKFKCSELIGENTEMSQLGNLRAIMGLLKDKKAVENTCKWLKVQDKGWMTTDLKNLFQEPIKIWEKLGGNTVIDNLAVVTPSLEIKGADSTFTRYAIVSTIHACIRAHKRDLEKNSGQRENPEEEAA